MPRKKAQKEVKTSENQTERKPRPRKKKNEPKVIDDSPGDLYVPLKWIMDYLDHYKNNPIYTKEDAFWHLQINVKDMAESLEHWENFSKSFVQQSLENT